MLNPTYLGLWFVRCSPSIRIGICGCTFATKFVYYDDWYEWWCNHFTRIIQKQRAQGELCVNVSIGIVNIGHNSSIVSGVFRTPQCWKSYFFSKFSIISKVCVRLEIEIFKFKFMSTIKHQTPKDPLSRLRLK